MEESSIFLGNRHSFLKSKQGIFFAAGNNSNGTLGLGNLIQFQEQFKKVNGCNNQQFQIKNISCHLSYHVLFLTTDGKVLGCGWSDYGQLGFKKENNPDIKELDFFKNKYKIEAIFTGNTSSFFLTTNDELFCCGIAQNGEFGNIKSNQDTISDIIEINTKEFLVPNERIIDISAGESHTLILSNQGKVYSSGNGKRKQLGNIHTYEKTINRKFERIQFFKKNNIKITQIKAGNYHSLFLSSDNKVFGCGSNEYGQISFNISLKNEGSFFRSILPKEEIIKIESGYNSSYFVTKNREIFVLGDNAYYQLGIDNPTSQIVFPTKLQDEDEEKKEEELKIPKFIDVYAGGNFTIFVDADGELYSCGENSDGQCGVGNRRTITKPTKIEGITIDIESILPNKQKRYIIEKTERFEFFIDSFLEDNSNFALIFPNQSKIMCLKSLLVNSEIDLSSKSSIEISKNLDIDEEEFSQLLFGRIESIPINKLCDYFILFYELKMKIQMSLICKQIETIKSENNLLILFIQSKKHFENKLEEGDEKEKEEEMEFEEDDEKNAKKKKKQRKKLEVQSVFTFTLLKILKKLKKKNGITTNLFFKVFGNPQSLKMIEQIEENESIYNHKDLKNFTHPKRIENFLDVYNLNYSILFCPNSQNQKKYCDLILESKDEKLIFTHKHVCLMESNLLFGIFKFGGLEITELKNSGKIKIENLNFVDLKSYLEYLYTKKIKKKKLENLIVLLKLSQMYLETKLKQFLVKEIKEMTKNWLKNDKNSFRNFLLSKGYLIDNSKPMKELIEFWSTFLVYDIEDINYFILFSKKMNDLEEKLRQKDV